MTARTWKAALGSLFAGCAVANTAAEVISVTGSAECDLIEIVNDTSSRSANDAAAEPGDPFPLRVVARLFTEKPGPAAGAIAAQFAEPLFDQANPEEFAINMALNSLGPEVRYDASASLVESRTIQFAPGELGPLAVAGSVQPLQGTLFLDGALSLLAGPNGTGDLSGAFVRLRVTIEQISSDGASLTLFDGGIELRGEGGSAIATVDGEFPIADAVLTELSLIDDDFIELHILALPDLRFDYDFDAVVGETFELRATVQAEGANRPGDVGVSLVLGTPTDAIQEVMATTKGDAGATTFLTALESERSDPSGEPAFPDANPTLCGLFGLEALLGLMGLTGWRWHMRRTTPRR